MDGAMPKGASLSVHAEAAIVQGEASASVSILGIQFSGSVGGGVGAAAGFSAQAGAIGKSGKGAGFKLKAGAPLFGSIGLRIQAE